MFLKFRVIDGQFNVMITRGVVKHVYEVLPFLFLFLLIHGHIILADYSAILSSAQTYNFKKRIKTSVRNF